MNICVNFSSGKFQTHFNLLCLKCRLCVQQLSCNIARMWSIIWLLSKTKNVQIKIARSLTSRIAKNGNKDMQNHNCNAVFNSMQKWKLLIKVVRVCCWKNEIHLFVKRGKNLCYNSNNRNSYVNYDERNLN